MAENETGAGGGSQPAKNEASQPIDEAAESALRSAQEAVAAINDISGAGQPTHSFPTAGPTATPADRSAAESAADAFNFPAFAQGGNGAGATGLELLSDVSLNVKIELGRTQMLVNDVLRLSEGAVVELDKLAGDPVDVYVNGRHVARGEVLVLNDNFCVRINQILSLPEAGRPKAAS